MSTASNAASGSRSASESGSESEFGSGSGGSESASNDDFESENGSDESESGSPSLFDRLQTVGRVVWATFLGLIVVFTLIPAVALWFGAVPFDAPPTTPYFAFVGALVVGTAALIAVAVYDV